MTSPQTEPGSRVWFSEPLTSLKEANCPYCDHRMVIALRSTPSETPRYFAYCPADCSIAGYGETQQEAYIDSRSEYDMI